MWMQGSTYTEPRHQEEVGWIVLRSVTFTPGKSPGTHLKEVEWTPGPIWRRTPPTPGIEHGPSSPQPSSLPLELLGPLIKVERIQNSNSVDLLVFQILIFKLILICKFQNVPCPLGFEVNIQNFSVEVSVDLPNETQSDHRSRYLNLCNFMQSGLGTLSGTHVQHL